MQDAAFCRREWDRVFEFGLLHQRLPRIPVLHRKKNPGKGDRAGVQQQANRGWEERIRSPCDWNSSAAPACSLAPSVGSEV